MTVYKNHNPSFLVSSFEYEPNGNDNIFIFHLAANADKQAARSLLKNAGLNVTAETNLDGHTILITSGNKTPDELLKQFPADQFEKQETKKTVDAWKWRGICSTIGQAFLLTSSLKASKTSSDRVAIGASASTSLLANAINMTVGSEEKTDPHHLRMLKDQFNEKFAKYLPEGQTLPSPDDNLVAHRPDTNSDPSTGEKARQFLRRNSVNFGDVAMRTFGSASLAFPVTKWKKGWQEVAKTGSLAVGHNVVRNENPLTYKAGLFSLAGKAFGLTAKLPDPYNPKKHTWLDTAREKYFYHLTSLMDVIAATVMGYDRFKNQKISFGGKSYRDYFGAVGNAVIIGGYYFRTTAPYGERKVDMKELDAHISEGLAKMPPDKIPQLLADEVATLKQHFGNDGPEIAQLYVQLLEDLKKYHHIDILKNDGQTPQTDKTVNFAKHQLQKSLKPADMLKSPPEISSGMAL